MLRFENWTALVAMCTLVIGFDAQAQNSTQAAAKATASATEKKSDSTEVKVDEKTKTADAFPVGASVSMGYSFNQMQFVECKGQDCGWQRISVGMGVSYTAAKWLMLSSGLNAGKTLETSYFNAGTASQTARTPWEVRDISLAAASPNLFVIPVADIKISSSLGLTFPLSKPSRAAGLIMAVSPGLSMSWGMAGFSVSLNGGYTYFLNDEATIALDCDRSPYNCVVSGNDTAIPNSLHNVSAGLRLGYTFLEMMSVSAGYNISRGMRAVEFDIDERASQYAQGGNQWGMERHSFSAGLSVRPFKKTSVSLNMMTGNSLYTQDNQSVQLPFYDGSLRQAFRTSYSLNVSQSL